MGRESTVAFAGSWRGLVEQAADDAKTLRTVHDPLFEGLLRPFAAGQFVDTTSNLRLINHYHGCFLCHRDLVTAEYRLQIAPNLLNAT